MGRVGSIMALLGVVSAVLSFTNYELRLLFWIENWGEPVAWLIRIGLVVVGVALIAAEGRTHQAAQPEPPAQSQPWN